MSIDQSKTLAEHGEMLSGSPHPESYLETECHRLMKVPLRDFGPEDFRIMIGQKFSLQILVPLALDLLQESPLAEGHMYIGDLACNVANVPDEYWRCNPDQFRRMVELKWEIQSIKETLEEYVLPDLERFEFFDGWDDQTQQE